MVSRLDLFPEGKLPVTLARMCHELIEHYAPFEDTVIIGIQQRGVFLARRIQSLIATETGIEVPLGELDVTFFRDDIRLQSAPLSPNRTHVPFLIERKRVILVDDVLYTGRTVRSALDAMLAFGRPASVSLLSLVRRKRAQELPVRASFVGIEVDTLQSERVAVELAESGGNDKVYLIEK